MIVIVEDDKLFLKNLIKIIERKNISNYKFFTDVENYEYIEADLYIFDLRIWNKKSFNLIKETNKKTNKPIIVLSSFYDRDSIINALRSWATFYLQKNTPVDILYLFLQNFLQLSNKINN